MLATFKSSCTISRAKDLVRPVFCKLFYENEEFDNEGSNSSKVLNDGQHVEIFHYVWRISLHWILSIVYRPGVPVSLKAIKLRTYFLYKLKATLTLRGRL